MGLAVVHGIVGTYGGTVTVASEPGKGSVFRVFLPVVESHPTLDTQSDDSIPLGSERILFVDDEPALGQIAKRMLESLGYRVTTRTSSIEALQLLKAKVDDFDLVITDMMMPNMAGDKLAKEITQIKPELPIILCTGYSARINQQQVAALGIRAFVAKPVLKKDLAQTVRKVLDPG